MSPETQLLDIPIPTLKMLNSYRDVESLLRTIPDLESFRTALRMVKAWARERGLYAPKFGYLGGQHITFLLSSVCKKYLQRGVVSSPTAIVRAFFAYYAAFNFERDFILDDEFHKLAPQYQRSKQEPMAALTLCNPAINVATNISTHTLRTITEELKRADELIVEDDLTWPRLLGLHQVPEDVGMPSRAAIDFLAGFELILRIDVHYWGASIVKGGRLVEWIDGKCPLLIAGKANPTVLLREANSSQTSITSFPVYIPESGLHASPWQGTTTKKLSMIIEASISSA